MAAPAQRSKAWTTVYFFFQIAFGQVLLPLLVATFTLSRARRHFTLINLCIAFIISSICQCLLLYAGRVTGPEPSPALCAFQGATANAVPPLWSTSLFLFVWNLRSQTIDRTEKGPSDAPSNAGSFLTMTLQYFVFLAFLIASAAVATIRPDMASRNWRALYCNLHVGPLNIVSATYTAVLAFTSLVLTVPTAKKLFSIYPWFRNKRSAMNSANTARGLNLRISAFMLFIAVGFIFSVWSDFDDYGFIRTRDMYLAIAPAVIFLLFGTQKDILEVWCFWRKITPVRRVPKLTRERTKVDTESTPDTVDWSPEVRLLHEPQSA